MSCELCVRHTKWAELGGESRIAGTLQTGQLAWGFCSWKAGDVERGSRGALGIFLFFFPRRKRRDRELESETGNNKPVLEDAWHLGAPSWRRYRENPRGCWAGCWILDYRAR